MFKYFSAGQAQSTIFNLFSKIWNNSKFRLFTTKLIPDGKSKRSSTKDHSKKYPPDTTTRDLQIMFDKYGKIDDCEQKQSTPPPDSVGSCTLFSVIFSFHFFCFVSLIPVFTLKNRENDKPRRFSFIRYRKVEDTEDTIKGMNGRVR